MRTRQWIWVAMLLLLVGCSSKIGVPNDASSAKSSKASNDVTVCSPAQLLAYSPNADEVKTHRRFTLPVISYPYNTKRDDQWGLQLTVRVDERGHVVCYSKKDEFERDQPLNSARLDVIEKLKHWQYAPFARNGQAVAAIVSERIGEQELPEKHLQLPNVPLNEVSIALERTGCFGMCPHYVVIVHGDGRVSYRGDSYADVEGDHVYHVSTDDVARLVESLRVKDLWSLRAAYHAPITDNPTYLLVMTFGGQSHKIEDYVGASAGMPSVVSDFEDQVDQVAHADKWVHLSKEAVEHLKEEGFDFRSKAGADLLLRAVANTDSHDDDGMLRLLELGAPIVGGSVQFGVRSAPASLIEEALQNHRGVLIDPLITRGALETKGKPNQAKIDSAFRAAIVGGGFALVQRIWAVSGEKPHPALTFDDVSDDDKPVHKTSPVTLLLSHDSSYAKGSWEGLEIAKWLAIKGCDIRAAAANGRTLLHIATQAGDKDFVRYLLASGMDPSTPGPYSLPALGSAQNEDVAMILLEAGTDFSRMDDQSHRFRLYAEGNHWQRVVAWMDAHHR